MNKLTIDKLGELRGKRLLVRVDFNVPMSKEEVGKISDDTRIRESLPTIKKIIGDGGRCILMSHLGRPKGEANPKYSLKPVARHLAGLLEKPVYFSDDCTGPDTQKMVNELKDGDVLLLENLRFHKEEEKNDDGFSKELASYGDIYVNDAFGAAHRAHASTVGVANYISTRAAGYLMQKELEFLSKLLEHPAHPFVAILGGSKILGKIDVIKNLLNIADKILIGGGMVFTFYKALGYEVGKSLLEEDKIDLAKELFTAAKSRPPQPPFGKGGASLPDQEFPSPLGKGGTSLPDQEFPSPLSKGGTSENPSDSGEGETSENPSRIVLPIDIVVADKLENEAKSKVVYGNEIPDDMIGMDIGPETVEIFVREIQQARTIFWNGPMGVFEMDNFAKGTFEIAKALAEATEKGAFTVIGGGDSAAAVAKAELEDKVSFVSTGGGASLEFLEGKTLPGVEALSDNN